MEYFVLLSAELLKILSIALILRFFLHKHFVYVQKWISILIRDPISNEWKSSDATFCGTGQSVYMFLNDIEDELVAKSIEECDKVSFCITGLRQNARNWAQSLKLKDSDISWLEFKSKLFRHYSKFHSVCDINRHLVSMKYEPGTNFEDFVWYFRDYYLLFRPKAGEKEIIKALFHKLPDIYKTNLPGCEEMNLSDIILKVKKYGWE